MEPFSAAVVVSMIARYAGHLGGAILDDLTAGPLRELWEAVQRRLGGGGGAEALERLRQRPDDLRRRAAVEDYVDEAVEADPDFAATLAALVSTVGHGTISDVRVRDAGPVALGGNVTIKAGGPAAGRDLTMGGPSAKRAASRDRGEQ